MERTGSKQESLLYCHRGRFRDCRCVSGSHSLSLSAVSISHPGIISVRSPAVDLIWAMFCFSRKAARNPSLPDAAAIFLPLFFPRCNRQETRSLLMIPPRQLHRRRHPHSPMKWSESPAPDAHALHFIFWTGDSSSSDMYMYQHSPV